MPFRLSFAHLRRNWFRSLLTVLSVTVTIFLYCTLRSVVTTLDGAVGAAATNRLITSSAVSLFVQLPISMWKKLENVPGVDAVTHWTWFAGVYKDESEFFARFGVDVPSMRRVYGDGAPEGAQDIVMPKEQWEAFASNRRACIVGEGLIKRYAEDGWKIGHRFPMIGNIFPGDYNFEIVGIYKPGSASFDAATMFFHWDYMNETAGRPDRVSTFPVLFRDRDRAGEISQTIDSAFENSPTRTRTFSEREFQAQFVQMWGNVPLLLTMIGAAVFFACSMITVNTMLLLARERVRETGILKAIGFRGNAIAGLSIFEALLLCLIGAGLGVGLALAAFDTEALPLESFLPGFGVKGSTAREAMGLGALLGLVSGLAPAIFVKRLSIIDTLRKVG